MSQPDLENPVPITPIFSRALIKNPDQDSGFLSQGTSPDISALVRFGAGAKSPVPMCVILYICTYTNKHLLERTNHLGWSLNAKTPNQASLVCLASLAV